MIEFQCESCGQRFRIPPDKAGKKAKCRCGAVITVPTVDVGPPPTDDRPRMTTPVAHPDKDHSWLDDLPDAGPAPDRPPPSPPTFQPPITSPQPTTSAQPITDSQPQVRHSSAEEGMLEAYSGTSNTPRRAQHTIFNNTVLAGVFIMGLATFCLCGGFLLEFVFYYPLIMFAAGLITLIIGLAIGK